MLGALILAFLSNLFGSITHYGSGQGAVYIGSGYLALPDVFKFGALFSVINLTIWAFVGAVAWKALGAIARPIPFPILRPLLPGRSEAKGLGGGLLLPS